MLYKGAERTTTQQQKIIGKMNFLKKDTRTIFNVVYTFSGEATFF